MRIRTILALLILAAAVVWAGFQVPRAGAWLAANRGRYLLNRGDWQDAKHVLEGSLRAHPGDEKLTSLLLLALLNGDANDGETAGKILAAAPQSGLRLFLAGVQAYDRDDEAHAAASFARAAENSSGLESWMLRVCALAEATSEKGSGESSGSARTKGAVVDCLGALTAGAAALDRHASRLERRMTSAYIGRACYAAGRHRQAQSWLAAARMAGDGNQRTAILACAAAAISGDYSLALAVADVSTSRGAFLETVQADLARQARETSAPVIALAKSVAMASVATSVARAGVWAQLANALDAPTDETTSLQRRLAVDAVVQFLSSHPGDPVGQMFQIDALESTGSRIEAFAASTDAMQTWPSYSLMLRMRNLSADSPAVRSREAEFLNAPGVAAYISADAFETSAPRTARGAVALLVSSSAFVTFEAPADGEYEVTVVACGDRAFGLSPLASLRLDGAWQEDMYVPSAGWDAYSFRWWLRRGKQRLQIEYVNDAVRRPTPAEDRNLYLESVIVSRAKGS